MQARIIENIRFEPDLARLLEYIHVQAESDDAGLVRELVAQAAAAARPKAVYGEAGVESRGEDFVVVDGVRFKSRVMRVNLDEVHRVFPYVATCGEELAAWAAQIDDPLEGFWADAIMIFALRGAIAAANKAIEADFHPGKTAAMNPGSLEDWPIDEQAQLFCLLDGSTERIGVKLSDSFLMIPTKSTSGLRFPTAVSYENCMLCPRASCPGRRAPYDEALYAAKYSTSSGPGKPR